MTDTDRDDVRCPKCGSQTPIGHRCIVDDLEAIRNADLSDHPFMRAIRGKTDRDDVGMLAEVLAVHQLHSSLNVCLCGTWRAMAGAGPLIDQHRDHLAAALLASSAMADLKARWQGEALREAADKWQTGAWTALTEPIKAERQAQRIIGAAQVVLDWLRDRAAANPYAGSEGA